MERCSPAQMRKALVVVDDLAKAGIEFMPIPVLDDWDRNWLINMLTKRMEVIENRAKEGK